MGQHTFKSEDKVVNKRDHVIYILVMKFKCQTNKQKYTKSDDVVTKREIEVMGSSYTRYKENSRNVFLIS